MTKVLARVTPAMDRPRGPDVQMTLRVPKAWLADGATVEVRLPRNLSCAVCHGGGCDACERAGALSLRGRKEPPEVVEVTLPKRMDHADARNLDRAIVVRIPDRGGFADEGSDLPRGNLLLSVRPSSEPGPGISRIDSAVPPAVLERDERGSEPRPGRPAASGPLSRPVAFLIGGVIAVVAWLLWRAVHAVLP